MLKPCLAAQSHGALEILLECAGSTALWIDNPAFQRIAFSFSSTEGIHIANQSGVKPPHSKVWVHTAPCILPFPEVNLTN